MNLTRWDALFLASYAVVIGGCIVVVVVFKEPSRPLITQDDVILFSALGGIGMVAVLRERSRKRRRPTRSSSSKPS